MEESCNNCLYEDRDPYEYPCVECPHCHYNNTGKSSHWRPNEETVIQQLHNIRRAIDKLITLIEGDKE